MGNMTGKEKALQASDGRIRAGLLLAQKEDAVKAQFDGLVGKLFGHIDELKTEIAKKDGENHDLAQKLAGCEARIAQQDGEIAELKQSRGVTEKVASGLGNNIQQLGEVGDDLTQKLDAANKRITFLEEELLKYTG